MVLSFEGLGAADNIHQIGSNGCLPGFVVSQGVKFSIISLHALVALSMAIIRAACSLVDVSSSAL
jgi:hypothetical protein